MGKDERILVVGSAGHARAVLDVVRSQGRYVVAGFIDGTKAKGTSYLGLQVLGDEKDLPEVCRAERTTLGIVAIGDNFQRQAMTERLRALVPAFTPVSAIHPAAIVAADATIGPGTVIMPGAVVVSGSGSARDASSTRSPRWITTA